MGRKKKTVNTAAAATGDDEFEYNDNLTVRVIEPTSIDKRGLLQHYFGDLLRDGVIIDRKHKYCSECLKAHTIKRLEFFLTLN